MQAICGFFKEKCVICAGWLICRCLDCFPPVLQTHRLPRREPLQGYVVVSVLSKVPFV